MEIWTQYLWLMYRSRAIFGIIFSSLKVILYTSKYITFDKTDQKEKEKVYITEYIKRGWSKF